MAAANKCLQTIDLSVQFGGLKALSNVNIEINSGELVGLIGPNGAGKTTFFNALTGNCQPSSGRIVFQGEDVTSRPPYFMAQKGMARTFQNIRLFKSLSVLDNLRTAYHLNCKYNLLDSILRSPRYAAQERENHDRCMEILETVNLAARANEIASNLSYGDQRRLEIARALVMQPQLLLLDEPAAGMNPHETHELVELLRDIQTRFSLTILLIEHDMSFVMTICQRLYVLDYGLVIASGSVQEVRSNPKVIEAYLGEDQPWQS